MKIAFVGKGGSGKSTLSALCSLYVQSLGCPLFVIDADVNIHLPELLGIDPEKIAKKHLSRKEHVQHIKEYLRGENERISSHDHFKKTTPPGRGSRWIDVCSKDPDFFQMYAEQQGTMDLCVVGTYEKDDIGASCYHNHLSILENILSHTVDNAGVVIVDMVAGVDAFAGSLYSQFDLIIMAVEPTKRSADVFHRYYDLAKEAGIVDRLFVVGNKVHTEQDQIFLKESIGEYMLSYLPYSPYLHRHDQEGGVLSFTSLEENAQQVFAHIYALFTSKQRTLSERLPVLWEIHKKYVAQSYVRSRFGDLNQQIDETLLHTTE